MLLLVPTSKSLLLWVGVVCLGISCPICITVVVASFEATELVREGLLTTLIWRVARPRAAKLLRSPACCILVTVLSSILLRIILLAHWFLLSKLL
jgi:hypothetical protein